MSLNSLKLPRQFGSGTEAVVLESAQLLIANNDSDGLYEEIPDAHVSLPYFKYFLMSDMLPGQSNLPCSLLPAEYQDDVHFQYFDCRVNMSQGPSYVKSPIKSGYTRLHLRFSGNLPCEVTVIALVVADQVLKIDKNAKVSIETT